MKKRCGFGREVWEQDSTGLKMLEGYLKKRSKRGSWQKRYFFLNNSCLNYAKGSKGKSGKVKASIDIRKVKLKPSLVDRFGGFQLEFYKGNPYQMKAKTLVEAQKWIEEIEIRRKYYLDLQKDIDEKDTDVELEIVHEGKLMKKSPSRFKAWQPRYFRLTSEGMLYYYKTEKSRHKSFLGQIVIDGGCKLRKCGHDPLVFYLDTHIRLYVLQACNTAEFSSWVVSIENLIKGDRSQASKISIKDKETQIAAKQVAQKIIYPQWMQEWDNMTDGQRHEETQKLMDVRFGIVQNNLLDTVNTATGLIEELEELACECLEVHNRADILEFKLCAYHVRLEHEIGYYLIGEQLENASNHDMLRLMDLIVAYEEFLTRIFQSDKGKEVKIQERIPPNTMLGYVEKMVSRYIIDLQDTLGIWVDNIVRGCLKRGRSNIETKDRSSTQLTTMGPLDVFNMVHETLAMARASGLPQLEGAALSACIVAIADYLSQLLSQIRVGPGNEKLKNDLLFLCAITNDCAMVNDEIDNLEKTCDVVAKEYNFCMDPLKVKYDNAAVSLLETISLMIQKDVMPLFSNIFPKSNQLFKQQTSNDHAHDKAFACIIATIEDYFCDLQQYLEATFFRKLIKIVSRMIIRAYCDRIINPVRSFGDIVFLKLHRKPYFWVLTPPNIRRLGQDDIRSIENARSCLLQCFSKRLLNSNYSDSTAEKLFKQELLPLDHIIDFLTVSPAFFPSTVLAECSSESSNIGIHGAILATAECCLALREDISKQTIQEIQAAYSKDINDYSMEYAKTKPNDKPGVNHIYQEIWSQWLSKKTSKDANNSEMLNEIITSRRLNHGDNVDSAMDTITIPNSLNISQTDISEEASKKRQLNRARCNFKSPSDNAVVETEASEPGLELELSGYLEKKRPGSRHLVTWQRRWFVLNNVLDGEDGSWKLALTWHINHKSKRRSRLFMNSVQAVDFITPIPVTRKDDGLFVIEQNLRKEKGVYRKQYQFQIVSYSKTYILRANSMSETVAWVNALVKAIQTVNSETNLDPLANKERAQKEMRLQYEKAISAGNRALDQENCELAEVDFSQAIHLAQALKSQQLEARAMQNLAAAYVKTSDKMVAGILLLEMVSESFKSLGSNEEFELCVLKVADGYIEANDKESALSYLKKQINEVKGNKELARVFAAKVASIKG